MSRLVLVLAVLPACVPLHDALPIEWSEALNEPCANNDDCYDSDAVELVELADGTPAIDFPAAPGERLPNVVQWSRTDLVDVPLVAACDESSALGSDAGLFEAADYPVAYGQPGNTTAFERLLGAPADEDFGPLESGRIYEVSAMHKDRFDGSGWGRTAWRIVFTPDGHPETGGLLWAHADDLCR